jgi:hypothetical protein
LYFALPFFSLFLSLYLNNKRIDDGSQRMYYVGQQGKDTAIGVAKLELGSTTWVKEQSSIVFA